MISMNVLIRVVLCELPKQAIWIFVLAYDMENTSNIINGNVGDVTNTAGENSTSIEKYLKEINF